MQITPAVGREWAAETGLPELQTTDGPGSGAVTPRPGAQYSSRLLVSGENPRAISGDHPEAEARMVAGYNAGPSRAAEWNRVAEGQKALTREEFINRIDIVSTRAYVNSILARYHKLKGRHAESRQRSGFDIAPTEVVGQFR